MRGWRSPLLMSALFSLPPTRSSPSLSRTGHKFAKGLVLGSFSERFRHSMSFLKALYWTLLRIMTLACSYTSVEGTSSSARALLYDCATVMSFATAPCSVDHWENLEKRSDPRVVQGSTSVARAFTSERSSGSSPSTSAAMFPS